MFPQNIPKATRILLFAILGLLLCTTSIGLIIAFIAIVLAILATKGNVEGRRRIIAALIISGLTFIISLGTMIKKDSEDPSALMKETLPGHSLDEYGITENPSEPSEEKPTEKEPVKEDVAKEEPAKEEPAEIEPAKEEPAREVHEYEYVFCAYILDNAKQYDNQYISTIVPITSVYSKRISSEVDGFEPNISASDIDTEMLSEGDWVKVDGRIDADMLYDVQFEDAYVEKVDRPSSFDDDMAKFYEEKHLAAIEERENFIASAQEVSYEDLRRYPDSYDGKPLKLTIKIKEAKPDGLIFQGDIFASYQGSEISVYDGRAVREPRFMDGDKINVYAKGDGLKRIKIKDGSGLFAKVIKEYEVPAIKVVYTDMDNLDNIEPIPEDDDMTKKGKEIGDEVAEELGNVDW